ncbi:hypothetical protein PROFUN_01076 [Planoprotostelium fungivorum]|uniref:C5orf34-like C-terminal domain-containing protein n=1 Tax=Planoprotostelium fungivorum TaxID=1890364 RepID=A0A2P6NC92_9EUKA|nr:hypothetical protein PROFUN_01076 [Planoprotostelium fungivorum]
MHFRNLYIEPPVLFEHLMQEKTVLFQSSTDVKLINWPAYTEGVESGNIRIFRGNITVTSSDGMAQLLLAPHLRLFRITFPSPIQTRYSPLYAAIKEKFGEKTELEFTFCKQRQIFSIHDCPSRWEYPLCLAIQAAKEYISSLELNQLESCDYTQSGVVTELPHHTGEDSEMSSTFLDVGHHDIYPYHGIKSEWRENVFYNFVPSMGTVEVIVSQDNSYMMTDASSFFSHFYPSECGRERNYPPHTPPPHVPIDGSGYNLLLHPIVERCSLILHRAAQSVKTIDETSHEEPKDTHFLSTHLHEELSLPHVGRFSAYRDGRVRALFVDRTILEVDRTRQLCQLILPDGSFARVTARQPGEYEKYVRSAEEFSQWAFLTPQERILVELEKKKREETCERVRRHLRDIRRILAIYVDSEVPANGSTRFHFTVLKTNQSSLVVNRM